MGPSWKLELARWMLVVRKMDARLCTLHGIVSMLRPQRFCSNLALIQMFATNLVRHRRKLHKRVRSVHGHVMMLARGRFMCACSHFETGLGLEGVQQRVL